MKQGVDREKCSCWCQQHFSPLTSPASVSMLIFWREKICQWTVYWLVHVNNLSVSISQWSSFWARTGWIVLAALPASEGRQTVPAFLPQHNLPSPFYPGTFLMPKTARFSQAPLPPPHCPPPPANIKLHISPGQFPGKLGLTRTKFVSPSYAVRYSTFPKGPLLLTQLEVSNKYPILIKVLWH